MSRTLPETAGMALESPITEQITTTYPRSAHNHTHRLPGGTRRDQGCPGCLVHLLFSPWLLVAIAIPAWIKIRPRRSRREPRCPAAHRLAGAERT